jgi:hypothetical protein
MRILLIAGVLVAVVSFDTRSSNAQEGPWCAIISLGPGSVYEDCRYRSLEACRPNVLAGNRGFCNPNPRWTGPVPKSRTRHKRRVQQS